MITHTSQQNGIRATDRRLRRSAVLAGLCIVLAACGLVGADAAGTPQSRAQDTAAVAGWTRIATTEKYLVIANVLPGERMFTAAENAAQHPTVGELCLIGVGAAVLPNSRHIEAHIYDRKTGLPLTDVTPSIVVLNRATGKLTTVPATLMQDVNIGALDIHFGNNVVIASDSDLKLTVTIGDEEVTFDGHLT